MVGADVVVGGGDGGAVADDDVVADDDGGVEVEVAVAVDEHAFAEVEVVGVPVEGGTVEVAVGSDRGPEQDQQPVAEPFAERVVTYQVDGEVEDVSGHFEHTALPSWGLGGRAEIVHLVHVSRGGGVG